jgi:hypothetical protein
MLERWAGREAGSPVQVISVDDLTRGLHQLNTGESRAMLLLLHTLNPRDHMPRCPTAHVVHTHITPEDAFPYT